MTGIDDVVREVKLIDPVRVTCDLLKIDERVYVVEGDRTLRAQDLDAYALERIELAELLRPQDALDRKGLVGKTRDSKLVRWARGKELTFTVLLHSFATEAEYEAVLDAVVDATDGWMGLCGVTFRHARELDERRHVDDHEVTFVVAGAQSSSGLVARAFFPDDRDHGGPTERAVLVFDTWFTPGAPFDRAGVIRHELGHVLGFRHEHIRPEAPEDFGQTFGKESLDDARELTPYDPSSVMHYLLPGIEGDLAFTPADEDGARRVYGAPDTEFLLVD